MLLSAQLEYHSQSLLSTPIFKKPPASEATSDSKTKTTTVHAIAMIEGAIAQPAVIYPYKEPEKIPLSNDYGVSMFFDYGTKALTPDLIFWYGTSVTA